MLLDIRMDIEEGECDGVDWIYLAYDMGNNWLFLIRYRNFGFRKRQDIPEMCK